MASIRKARLVKKGLKAMGKKDLNNIQKLADSLLAVQKNGENSLEEPEKADIQIQNEKIW